MEAIGQFNMLPNYCENAQDSLAKFKISTRNCLVKMKSKCWKISKTHKLILSFKLHEINSMDDKLNKIDGL